MTRADNPITIYVTDAEKAQLQEWASEANKSVSELGREALTEYTDYDRLRRIEDKLDEALSLAENSEHTHTRVTESSSVPEKARAIAKRLHTNHDPPIKSTDVELAIEDIAGADERTLDKYKTQLKKRQLLFRHPFQPVWTDDKSEWVGWVERSDVADQSHELIEDYNMELTEFEDIAAEVTQ